MTGRLRNSLWITAMLIGSIGALLVAIGAIYRPRWRYFSFRRA